MDKQGVSSGFECEELNRRTGCQLKMRLAVDLSAREGIYTQSESESRKKARIVDLNVRKGENGVKEWL